MGCITEISTLHEVKGRVRFRVPQIKWSPNNSSQLKGTLRKLPGVYHFKACVHSGTAVIYYNRRVLSKKELEEVIHHCPFPESEEQKPNTPPPVHIKEREKKLENGQIAHKHFLLFDLLKHGIMAGGTGSGIAGHIPLAVAVLFGWRMLKKRVHRKKVKKGDYGQKFASPK